MNSINGRIVFGKAIDALHKTVSCLKKISAGFKKHFWLHFPGYVVSFIVLL